MCANSWAITLPARSLSHPAGVGLGVLVAAAAMLGPVALRAGRSLLAESLAPLARVTALGASVLALTDHNPEWATAGLIATALGLWIQAARKPSRLDWHLGFLAAWGAWATRLQHAHIDTAWLWPIRETIRKCTRTFASAVRLMDDYPEYRFSCSQAQQYAWIEERHPDLFERITVKVRGGQWIPVGGMWVEADMNLPSGESLARQIVHGQRWFESRFGMRCTEVWIPDVFGYPASLPQIFVAGGCDRFVTSAH